MDFPDDAGKFVPFSFTIVDGGGQPAKVDGDPVLTIDRDDILALSTPLTTNDGLFSNAVFSMDTAADGTLWVGSFGGVARIAKQ